MTERIVVREMVEKDGAIISRAFAEQGWNKPESRYHEYFRASQVGKRVILLAESGSEFSGYVTIVWDSDYPPFKARKTPEIVDLNVLMKYQRRGIGTALMDEAERRIARRSDSAGIGVGLTADYGAAQIMYSKRSYVPDGPGIFQQGKSLKQGDRAIVDDDLTLYLSKSLS